VRGKRVPVVSGMQKGSVRTDSLAATAQHAWSTRGSDVASRREAGTALGRQHADVGFEAERALLELRSDVERFEHLRERVLPQLPRPAGGRLRGGSEAAGISWAGAGAWHHGRGVPVRAMSRKHVSPKIAWAPSDHRHCCGGTHFLAEGGHGLHVGVFRSSEDVHTAPQRFVAASQQQCPSGLVLDFRPCFPAAAACCPFALRPAE
jgi:hypothetical protein